MTHSVGRPLDNQRELDTRALRHALGRFATGVCVVTGLDANGQRLAMTVNSFSSVSLAPPLVLFSIARTCRGFEGWMSADRYGVNVLAAHQAELSNRFAGALADKWAGLTVATGPSGVPLLPDAIARFECELERREDGGDHVIFLGSRGRLRCGAARGPAVLLRRALLDFGGYQRANPRRADLVLRLVKRRRGTR